MKAVVFPPPRLDSAAIAAAVEDALTGTAKDVKVDFEVTVQTWNTQPEFVIEKVDGGRAVYTTNQIYSWVNDGTPAHIIEAVNAPVLVFPSKFRAKTQPGEIKSLKGYKGGDIIFTRRVNHPGMARRGFDEVIQKKWQDEFPRNLQRAIDAAVESGSK